MRVAIYVIADPPIAGLCLPSLLAAHTPEWTAGLHAAMLRDTLDGLQSIDAEHYAVVHAAANADEDGKRLLKRHAPDPWQVRPEVSPPIDGLALVVRAEAPSALIDPLLDVIKSANEGDDFAVLGPGDRGDVWLYGATPNVWKQLFEEPLPDAAEEQAATIRVKCTRLNITLHELPQATLVTEPSAVLTLLEELRRHPERAPRTAQFVVTNG